MGCPKFWRRKHRKRQNCVAHGYIHLPPSHSPQTHPSPWLFRLQETFGAFCVFFVVFAKTWDSLQKMAGGPFQNGRGFFELRHLFSNTNYQLKIKKKYSWNQRFEFYRLIFFFIQKNFCRYTPIVFAHSNGTQFEWEPYLACQITKFAKRKKYFRKKKRWFPTICQHCIRDFSCFLSPLLRLWNVNCQIVIDC